MRTFATVAIAIFFAVSGGTNAKVLSGMDSGNDQ
jgi:hypothetical protein